MIGLISNLVSIVSQVKGYIAYVAGNFRTFYLVLLLTFAVLALEYLATSLMIPMARLSAPDESSVTQAWNAVAFEIGLAPSFRVWLWLFIVVMVVRLILGYVLTVLTTWLGKQVHESLSGKVFRHILLREPMALVYTRSVGHYITIAGDDTFKSGTIVSSILQALVGFFTAGVGLVVLYQFSSVAFGGLVLFLTVCAIILVWLLRRVLVVNARAVSLSRELGTTFVEALNSLRSIRSLSGERYILSTYAEQIHRYIQLLVQIDAVKAGVKAMPAILLLLIAAFMLSPHTSIEAKDTSLFAGTVIVIRIFASLGQMVTAGSQLLTDIRAVGDIEALSEIRHEQSDEPLDQTGETVQRLSLREVTFSYGARGRVLNRVSFDFDAGNTYAIVGPSGSGKSTLADILLGLIKPDSGAVVVNNAAISIFAARSRFVLVEQQPKIFSSSVKDNLLMGIQASDADLYSALEIVNLAQVVRSLPQGLDTRLTYLGENFSGGQRQRLGIARALLRNPDVLILDEATSALDTSTRIGVVAKLRDRMRNGIIIFITHDAEIAALADQVLDIEAGRAG